MRRSRRKCHREAVAWSIGIPILFIMLSVDAFDLRGDIIAGTSDDPRGGSGGGIGSSCLQYDGEEGRFWLKCDLTSWENNDWITLHAKEVFDGSHFTIDLSGTGGSFEGLFAVKTENDDQEGSEGKVERFEQAPIIRNLRTINGETSDRGG
eukprot:gb/GECG01008608.1/.p1 GENE.gb/GECG01008608.1/~~gb/GECG01008608.1/.p1  ORF type:complete len:151 (+),score=15.53 gb/GECG01008608.1/:1-453(+)